MLISFFDHCGVDYSCNISLSSVFTYVFFLQLFAVTALITLVFVAVCCTFIHVC